MLIAHLTDCHIVEPGGLVADRVDTAAALRRAVEAICRLEPRPDVVLATGDLVDDGRPAQYDHLMELLGPLDRPVLAVPGNHDVRAELRARFEGVPAGADHDPVDYVVDDHAVRLIGLDTSIAGSHAGRLTDAQLAWLDDRLDEAPDRPTVLFQHHPPFVTGLPHMDAMGLDGIEREAAVLCRHTHVEAVVCGHLHRSIQTRFAGTIASCWPSTGAQLALQLTDGPVRYSGEPAAIALHRWHPESGLTSHLVPIVDHEEWSPGWAHRSAV